MKRSAIAIEKTGTGCSAYVPDLPGCISVGRTRQDLDRNIREAMDLYLDELVGALPSSTKAHAAMKQPAAAEKDLREAVELAIRLRGHHLPN